MKAKLWVFGFGQFMEFFAPHLAQKYDIYIYDRDGSKTQNIYWVGAIPATFSEAASCENIILWYPAGSIPELVKQLAPLVEKGTLVFDICSVKTPAVEAMQTGFSDDVFLIATHPIFWPQSGKNGVTWLKMTFSNISAPKDIYDDFKDFFASVLELNTIEISPEKHDREMAYVQWITHFIGRTLKKLVIPDTFLATESYKHLRETSELVGYDSEDLFLSIQKDNPFVEETRHQLLGVFQELNTWIYTKK